jgi:polyribonucleotide nucleotidyltransferase
VEDEVKVGDEIMVKVIEIDRMGRVNLSRRAVFQDEAGGEGARPPAPPQGQGDRPQRPGGFRGGDRGRGGPPRNNRPNPSR